MNYRYLASLIFLIGCNPWSEQTVTWNISPTLFACAQTPAESLRATWTKACGSAAFDSFEISASQRNQGLTWPTQWPKPSATCTVRVAIFHQETLCRSAFFVGDSVGNISLQLQDSLGQSALPTTERETACSLIHADTSLRNWWIHKPTSLDSTVIASLFAQAFLEASTPTLSLEFLQSQFIIPWNSQELQALAKQALLTGKVSREQYLAWPARMYSHLWIDSILAKLPALDSNGFRRIGSCPASTQYAASIPFRISNRLYAPSICGVSLSGLTQAEANTCALRNGGRLPSLQELRCERNFWNDSIPFTWSQNPSEWSSDSTVDGYGILVETKALDPFVLSEIRPGSRPSLASFHLILGDSTLPLCKP